jgi:hypothetical protein
MTCSRSHDNAAKRIAKKLRSEYNSGKGVDINAPQMAVEVETPETVKDGIRQLQGFRKPVYIAGSNKKATEKALEITKETTIGVMDSQGNIMRPSTRKKVYV